VFNVIAGNLSNNYLYPGNKRPEKKIWVAAKTEKSRGLGMGCISFYLNL
jgi:hypothetical protein